MSLTMGTPARMGPGFFPMMLAIVLGVLGLLTLLEGRHGDEVSEGTDIRAVVLVAGSVIVFALSIESLGLVPTVALTSFLLSLADRQVRILSSLIMALVFALFSWLVFSVALSISWPAFGYLFG